MKLTESVYYKGGSPIYTEDYYGGSIDELVEHCASVEFEPEWEGEVPEDIDEWTEVYVSGALGYWIIVRDGDGAKAVKSLYSDEFARFFNREMFEDIVAEDGIEYIQRRVSWAKAGDISGWRKYPRTYDGICDTISGALEDKYADAVESMDERQLAALMELAHYAYHKGREEAK